MLMSSAGQFDIARYRFESASMQVVRTLACTIGIHDDIKWPRLGCPKIKIFPLQKGVHRSTRVKRQGMRFHPEENDRVGRRRILANNSRESSILTHRLVSR